MNLSDNYMTKEDADRIISNLHAVNAQLMDVLAQLDELQAQLNARIEEIRDVVEERDEARTIARRLVKFAFVRGPADTEVCVFCDRMGRYKRSRYESINHTVECPLKIMEKWD